MPVELGVQTTLGDQLLVVAVLRHAAAVEYQHPIGPDYAHLTAPTYANMRKTSIYGGSNEIQRNIIAKMVLGL